MSPASLAVLAYAWWGLVPAYWKQLPLFSSEELMLSRVLLSALSLLPIIFFRKELGSLLFILRKPRALLGCLLSSLLIGFNWYLYIWAIGHDRVVESSLGYFMNPLVNMALGTLILGEKLNGPQKLATLFAALGTISLTVQTGSLPWVAILLALSFGFYGFVRKVLNLPTLAATFSETIVLSLPAALALGWLFQQGTLHSPSATYAELGWLSLSGLITTIPLLAFAEAAKFLPLSFMGFLQFLSPTLQFALGVFVYNEPFGPERWTSFSLIWIGLLVFLWDLGRRRGNLGLR